MRDFDFSFPCVLESSLASVPCGNAKIASCSWCVATCLLNRPTLTETSSAATVTGGVDVAFVRQIFAAQSLQKDNLAQRTGGQPPAPPPRAFLAGHPGKRYEIPTYGCGVPCVGVVPSHTERKNKGPCALVIRARTMSCGPQRICHRTRDLRKYTHMP